MTQTGQAVQGWMDALVLQQPEEARLQQVARPEAGAGNVLLEVRRVGLCGSDLNSFRGRNPMVSFPRIPGHEVAATLLESVPGNPRLTAGTNVTLSPYTSCGICAACRNGRPNACRSNQTLGVQRDGAMARYISMPPQKLFPAQLSLEALCLVEPLTVGFHAAARAQVGEGESVAILGSGGVGLGAIAGCRQRGARTIAVDMSKEKLQLAQQAGADEVLDARDGEVVERLRAMTGGEGPSVLIEAIGTPETFRMAVDAVAFTGRVVYIGYAKEPVCYETKLFVQKELDIRGSRNALPEDFQAVIAMLESGRFPVEQAVSHIVPLADAAEMLAAWSREPSAYGKIMVNLD